jgi:hypothetical protein
MYLPNHSQTRKKPDQLKPPESLADKRSKEMIAREEFEQNKFEEAHERERKLAMGIRIKDKKNWISHYKLPDKEHHIGNSKRIELLSKDPFNPDPNVNPEYERDNMFTAKPYFKLFFRPLAANDKDKFLSN